MGGGKKSLSIPRNPTDGGAEIFLQGWVWGKNKMLILKN